MRSGMGEFFSRYRNAWIATAGLLVLTTLYFNGTKLRYGNPEYSENSSYLSSLTYQAHSAFGYDLNRTIFGMDSIDATSPGFYRDHYSMVGRPEDQVAENERMNRFMGRVNQLLDRHQANLGNSVTQWGDSIELGDGRRPLGLFIGLLVASQGRPMTFKLHDEWRLRSRSLIRNGAAQEELHLSTDATSTGVKYNSVASGREDPLSGVVTQRIPGMSAKMTASYGATTGNTSTGVSQNVAPNADVYYNYNKYRSGGSFSEHAVGVGYSLGF